jgi:hypothetical protein
MPQSDDEGLDLAEGRIKGAALREFLEWYRATFGEDDLRHRLAGAPTLHSLPNLDLGVVGCGVLASGWYGADDIHVLLDAIARGRTETEVRQLVTAGAQAALTRTLTGLHRTVMRVVGSPKLHARFAQRLWSTYYDTGRVQSVCVNEHTQSITYTDWTSHHPVLCTMTTASDSVIFPLMGLSGVTVSHVSCVLDGAPGCTHLVEWQ